MILGTFPMLVNISFEIGLVDVLVMDILCRAGFMNRFSVAFAGTFYVSSYKINSSKCIWNNKVASRNDCAILETRKTITHILNFTR